MSRLSISARRWATCLLFVFVIPVTGAGCGNDAPMSDAAYRREINAVCRSTRIAIAKLPEVDVTDPAALVKSGRRVLAEQRAATRALGAIRAPSRSSNAARRWLVLVRQALDSVDESLRAQARGDLTAAATANAKGARLVTAADAAARSLGGLECVTPAA